MAKIFAILAWKAALRIMGNNVNDNRIRNRRG
jgi:hypothetical protein